MIVNESKHKAQVFNSISELHRALGMPKPLHPLVSLVNYADISKDTTEISKGMIFNFYKISYKKNYSGKVKYGQSYYDFDEGGLSFVSPNQVISAAQDEGDYEGYTLLVHPDFIRNFPLGKKIKDYGFFSYTVAEALFLSEREKEVIVSIFKNMEMELGSAIDLFSQEVVVSQLELLLSYSKRYYNRQFITRKTASNDLLIKAEELLDTYFNLEKALLKGVPSVHEIANELNVSSHYLSDMLRSLTGQNTQQHIHNRLIDKAKDLLSTTSLSVAEIAYQLGFEHPQSFNELFKSKTKVSPMEFRQSFQ